MKTEYGEIRLLDDNPRKITDAALKRLTESIERDPQFMLLRPIVIDGDNVVIGGNQRLKACRALNMSELPTGWCVKAAGLTAEQRRRFILVDNAPEGMAGAYDEEMLKECFADLDLTAFGFDIKELAETKLTKINTEKPPPKMAWMLVGVPICVWESVAHMAEEAAQIDCSIVETTINDDTKEN